MLPPQRCSVEAMVQSDCSSERSDHLNDSPVYYFRIRGRSFAYATCSARCASLDDCSLSVLPEAEGCRVAHLPRKYAAAYSASETRSAIRQGLEFLAQSESTAVRKPRRHGIQGSINTVSLHVAHDCNMRCEYCYASGGSFGDTRVLMSQEMVCKALDFAFSHSNAKEGIHVGFFGGEPLLNFDVMTRGVEYARKLAAEQNRQVEFSVVTNATLLTPRIMHYLSAHGFSVIFSIDGPAGIHDRHRRTANGKRSHARILRNILEYSRNYSSDFTVRGTFTRATPNFSEQVLFLNDLGFRAVSVEEAQLNARHPLSITTSSELMRVKAEYDKLADAYLDRFRRGEQLHFYCFENCLRDIIQPDVRLTACGAGSSTIAVAPDGRVFPCFESVVEPENCIGHVDSGFDARRRLRFQRVHVDSFRPCRECWLKYYCGGGCRCFNIRYNRSIAIPHEPNCELIKYRYMISAWILSEIAAEGRQAVERLMCDLGMRTPVVPMSHGGHGGHSRDTSGITCQKSKRVRSG